MCGQANTRTDQWRGLNFRLLCAWICKNLPLKKTRFFCTPCRLIGVPNRRYLANVPVTTFWCTLKTFPVSRCLALCPTIRIARHISASLTPLKWYWNLPPLAPKFYTRLGHWIMCMCHIYTMCNVQSRAKQGLPVFTHLSQHYWFCYRLMYTLGTISI